jgi:hypothetical protein
MSTPYLAPAQRLAELLETLPVQERIEITGWLLQRTDPGLAIAIGQPGLRRRGRAPAFEREIASSLPVGEESQLVTIRLPAQQHALLRSWCNEHDFTMAAVVRGLVERFLDQQVPRPAAD